MSQNEPRTPNPSRSRTCMDTSNICQTWPFASNLKLSFNLLLHCRRIYNRGEVGDVSKECRHRPGLPASPKYVLYLGHNLKGQHTLPIRCHVSDLSAIVVPPVGGFGVHAFVCVCLLQYIRAIVLSAGCLHRIASTVRNIVRRQ